MPATDLTAGRLAVLRAEADQQYANSGGFVDPRRIRVVLAWWRYDLREWAETITGRAPITDLARLPWRDWLLLDLAHTAEPNPPPPPRLTAQHEAQRLADEQQATAGRARVAVRTAEWEALRAALPVPVVVAHNFQSRRHSEWHIQGADHILVQASLDHGRLHRVAFAPLCWAPSKRRDFYFPFPHDDDPTSRWPSCRTCIRVAYRITGRTMLDPGLLPKGALL